MYAPHTALWSTSYIARDRTTHHQRIKQTGHERQGGTRDGQRRMEPEPVGVNLEGSEGSEAETVKDLMGRLEEGYERAAVMVHEAQHSPNRECSRFDVT